MGKKFLLTSFDVWEPHQRSNSSDDLLTELLKQDLLPENSSLLQKIPVSFQLAPEFVIAQINELKPDVIICCGMAEARSVLTIESNGKGQQEIIHTSVDLERLIQRSIATQISHDAGSFVCNHLYYSVLRYLRERQLATQCIFVHVPVLNTANLPTIVQDFLIILQTIGTPASVA